MWRFPMLLLIAGVASGAELKPEDILLQRARVHMARTLSGLPNYTCLQTIERSQRAAPNRKPKLLDIVRIEVALVNGKELFAWPGSHNFTDQEISDMVKGGAIGNGNFALHAKAVFQSNSPAFTYAGDVAINGRHAHKWTYAVAQFRSGYTLRVGTQQAIVGYSGAIYIDTDTLDAIRLEVAAEDIPPELRIKSASDAVEYARVKIGSESFLLPSLSELQMTDIGGSENLNRTRFSSCRQYMGESTLVFDDPPPESAKANPPRTLDAPAGLTIDLSLQSALDLSTAAIGDPVTGILMKPIKLPDTTVIPKGALVHGRLTALRPAQVMRYSGTAVGITFFELESGNTHVRMQTTLQDLITASPAFLNRGPMARGLSHQRLEDETIFGSIFFVRDYTRRLDRGLRMMWRTTPMQPEERQ